MIYTEVPIKIDIKNETYDKSKKTKIKRNRVESLSSFLFSKNSENKSNIIPESSVAPMPINRNIRNGQAQY